MDSGSTSALVVGATALEVHGLKRWEREEIQVGVPHDAAPSKCLDGVRFERSRRPLPAWASPGRTLPTLRLQPAILMFASDQRSDRARVAVLAAAIQQRLTTPESLLEWLARLAPLRAASGIRSALAGLADGAQSMAEVDVATMCRTFGIARAIRQVKRRDSAGRARFTDCEWRLPGGRVLILEVDGGFHMDADRWEDDIVRERGLIDPRVLMVRCTARELRDCPDQVAHDLIRLGAPRVG
ncbi:MAG: hypothetical protein ACSLEW_08795 [Nocardioides sp.]